MTPGAVIIVSGPSGSGKSTLIRGVLGRDLRLRLAVSATTRQKRPGEIDGVHYYFWTRERFLEGVARNEFLEYAEVHGKDCYYGTPRSEVEQSLQDGWGVILDIDVQGAAQVRRLYPDHLSVFIQLRSLTLYEQRLRERGEPEESIARRMQTARVELDRRGEYQHVITNDVKEDAITEFYDLLSKHLAARRS
jgi:guanylate kinase